MLLLSLATALPANRAIGQGLPPAAGIAIGQAVPDISFAVHNYKTPVARLSDFRGKLLILDFWATYCSPCIAMIPRMDSLQQKFAGKLQFISVTGQTAAVAQPFLAKLNKAASPLPQVFADTQLHALFPHAYLPHYVWIDAAGLVRAITSFDEVNAAKIDSMIRGTSPALTVKQDKAVAFDRNQALFLPGSAGNVLYQSTLRRYTEGLGFGYQVKHDSTGGIRITARNLSPFQLYQIVYSKQIGYSKDRMLVQVKDSGSLLTKLHGQPFIDWAQSRTYCYELILPKQLADSAFQVMKQDLERSIPQYRSYTELRSMPCIQLVSTAANKLSTLGGAPSNTFGRFGFSLRNTPLATLVNQLNASYLRNLNAPVIDRTGYTAPVDIDIEADLTSIEELNAALKKYGLQLRQAETKLPVFILADNP